MYHLAGAEAISHGSTVLRLRFQAGEETHCDISFDCWPACLLPPYSAYFVTHPVFFFLLGPGKLKRCNILVGFLSD